MDPQDEKVLDEESTEDPVQKKHQRFTPHPSSLSFSTPQPHPLKCPNEEASVSVGNSLGKVYRRRRRNLIINNNIHF
jgi:hypothetical protein